MSFEVVNIGDGEARVYGREVGAELLTSALVTIPAGESRMFDRVSLPGRIIVSRSLKQRRYEIDVARDPDT